MKVKVIKRFIDKNTRQLKRLDDEFDCSEKRFSELVGYVEKVKEAPKTDVKK